MQEASDLISVTHEGRAGAASAVGDRNIAKLPVLSFEGFPLSQAWHGAVGWRLWRSGSPTCCLRRDHWQRQPSSAEGFVLLSPEGSQGWGSSTEDAAKEGAVPSAWSLLGSASLPGGTVLVKCLMSCITSEAV